MRLLKFGPRKTKSLLEEYFYVFVVILTAATTILGKAGGLSGYDAIVMGLWVGGITWFAWQLKNYLKEKSKTEREKEPLRTPETQVPTVKGKIVLPPGMKPMIGPQWPLKNEPGQVKPVQWPKPAPVVPGTVVQAPAAQSPAASGNQNRPGFIYERPTLPDRKPKLPANWPGQQNKKPKR